MRVDYNIERFTKIRVCGIECDFSDMRIDGSTVQKKRYQYEVADNDESQGDPARVGIVIREACFISLWILIYVYKSQRFQCLARFEN